MDNNIDPSVVIIVGALIPIALAVINRYHWPAEVKALVDFVIVVAVGIGAAFAMGDRDAQSIATVVAAVYGLAQAAFHGVYQPTGAATAIEKTTS